MTNTVTVTDVAFYCSEVPYGSECDFRLEEVGNPGNQISLYAQTPASSDSDPPLVIRSGLSVSVPPATYKVVMPVQGSGNTIYSKEYAGALFAYIATDGDSFTGGPSRILSVAPISGSTLATSTSGSYTATVSINPDDRAATGYQTPWRVQANVIASAVSRPVVNISYLGSGIISSSTSYYANGNAIDFNSIGIYTVRWQLQKPTTGFFDFLFGNTYDTVDSTTTTFIVSTTTAAENFFRGLRESASAFVSNASSTLSWDSCVHLAIIDCVQYLFVPSGESFSQFDDIDITHKPPIGYFFASKDIFATTTASTTVNTGGQDSLTFYVFGWIGNMFRPLTSIIGDIVMLIIAIWLFTRITRWDWSI